MLAHEETMRLIALAQDGDEEAKAKLLTENTPLLKSIIKRYVGKHIEYDDLMQIAGMGLLKAIKNFSTNFNVRFSTYAVPMILGEVKRFMRDDGYLKVSRSVKSQANKIAKFVEDYRKDNQDEPTVEQIAQHFGIESAEAVFIMDSTKMPVSIFEKTGDSDGKSLELLDRIADDTHLQIENKVILKDMLSKLSVREQKIVVMRYFQDMTQGDIARLLGVSQVQVSRLEYKIIEKLRADYTGEK